MIAHIAGGIVRPGLAAERHIAPGICLDEAMALRRCATHRNVFRGTGVSYPASVLRFDAVASWVKKRGVATDVASVADLELVRRAGVDASSVVLHCQPDISVSIWRAGFSRFIVDDRAQIDVLADNLLARLRRVFVDVGRCDELSPSIVAHARLDLVGLHCPLTGMSAGEVTGTVVSAIARMAWIRRSQDVLLSGLSLGGIAVPGGRGDPRALRRLAGIIDQAVEDGCIRYRFPRPTLTVSPDRSDLLSDERQF